MIKELFKVLIVVIILVVLIPLVMLLFGEGALAYKIFGWAFPKKDKQEVVMSSSTSTAKQTATVKHIFVDHNTYEDGKKGMTITVEYETTNLKDTDLVCLVRFYNEDGSPLAQNHYDEKYTSVNGNVIVYEYASPSYDACATQISLFMPYDELPHGETERTEYIMDASILHYLTDTEFEVLERSRTYSFYLSND